MKARILPKLLLLLTVAGVALSGFDASARIIRQRHSHQRYYRQSYRQPAPPKPQPPPKPKTLSMSGAVVSVWTAGRTLTLRDDNTKSSIMLVITPNSKFTRDRRPILPETIKPQEHVTVTYQDTDLTLREVKVTALAEASPAPKAGKAAPRKK